VATFTTDLAASEDLRSLRRKYEEILRLRRIALADPANDPRRAMATLAAEFPGSLREADALPLVELGRRIASIARVERGDEPVASWMTAMIRFHALTRGALCVKKWLGGRKDVDAATFGAFDREADGLCYARDARAWEADLDRVARPPKGRITDLVLARIAVELGVQEHTVRRWVLGVDPHSG